MVLLRGVLGTLCLCTVRIKQHKQTNTVSKLAFLQPCQEWHLTCKLHHAVDGYVATQTAPRSKAVVNHRNITFAESLSSITLT